MELAHDVGVASAVAISVTIVGCLCAVIISATVKAIRGTVKKGKNEQ